MGQKIESAAKQFVESEFFIKGVLEFNFIEIESELIKLLKQYHVDMAIQSVKVYAKNRYSTDQVVKPALREQPYALVNYYPRKFNLTKKSYAAKSE